MDISSLDFVISSLYNSKFSNWLNLTTLKSLITKDSWILKTSNWNIQLEYIKNNLYPLVKGKFNIGLVLIKTEDHLQHCAMRLSEYSKRSDLIGFIEIEPIREDDFYIYITYKFNIYNGVDLYVFLDCLYTQIEMIKEDIKCSLGIKLVGTSINNIKEQNSIEEDEEEDEEDDDENKSPTSLVNNSLFDKEDN